MYIDIHPHPFNQTLQPTNPFNQPTSKLEIIQPVHPSRLGMGRLVKDINNAVAVAVCLVPQRWPGTQRKAVQETSWAYTLGRVQPHLAHQQPQPGNSRPY